MIDLKQGDCLDLMKNIPDKSIDMILCDLPYGTTRNKWDKTISLIELWNVYNKIIKDNGAIILFSQMPYSATLVQSNLKMFRYEIIWEKTQGTGFLNAKKMPLKIHENILVFYKNLPTYNPQMRLGFKPYKTKSSLNSSYNYHNGIGNCLSKSDGERYPVDIIKFDYDRKDKVHPTQKPVALLEYLIKTFSNAGDTILDNCMGGGSTGIACVNTNRNFIGIELDETYFNIAKERIEKAQNGKQN